MRSKGIFITAGVIALLIIGGAIVVSRNRTTEETEVAPTETPEHTTPMPTPEAHPRITPIEQRVQATIHTSMGDIVLELDGERAPLTVGNFVQLAESDFYDDVTFHRVIPDFMIQTGCPLSKNPEHRLEHGTGDPGYTFEDEINEQKLVKYSVAMANSGPNTNGSQFFIVTAQATPWLDGLHTNFGEVIEGMEIVEAISKVESDQRDNPLEPITVERVTISDGT
jgi:cyclophilin family peptidyl-prolyl cis-trans isomerase